MSKNITEREKILAEMFERIEANSLKMTEEEIAQFYDFIEEKVCEIERLFAKNVIEMSKTLKFKNIGK